MSNMKVGGRVYRDVEKMNLDQLHEVRVALITLLDKKVKEGSKIQRTPQGQATFVRLNKEIEEIQKRLKRIDELAKPLIKADTRTKLADGKANELPIAIPAVVTEALKEN